MSTRSKSASATTTPDPSTPQPNSITRNPKTPFSSSPTIISASVKSVLLDDWWLVKAQGKGLAVEGFALRERVAVRTFSSAAILKRHTATILETIDGIIVTVCGLLDISRTSQNGFPPEVYNRYLFGFPFDWDEHAVGLLGQGSPGKSASARNSPSQKFNMSSEDVKSNPVPFSIDDVPAIVTRDFIMSCVGDSGDCSPLKSFVCDILRTSRDNAFGDTTPPINSNMESSRPVENVKSERNGTPTKAKKVKVDDDDKKSRVDYLKGRQKSKMGMYSTRSQTSMKSAATRSSTRLKNLK